MPTPSITSTGPLGAAQPLPVAVPLFYAGDAISLLINLRYNEQSVTPSNSRLFFKVKVDQYHEDALFVARWNEYLTESGVPGTVKITIPPDVTSGWYAGSYAWAVTATDAYGNNPKTIASGHFLLRYSASTATPAVSY